MCVACLASTAREVVEPRSLSKSKMCEGKIITTTTTITATGIIITVNTYWVVTMCQALC